MVRVEVELLGRALAGEAAQPAERDAHVAHAELDGVVEVLELALVPHLDGAEVAVAVLADADAFGVVAVGAEGRGAGGADPFRAALVAALLLLETLPQGLEELVPAHRLDLPLLLFGEVFLGELAQPFGRDLGFLQGLREILQALEDMAENAVELVEVALVLHEAGARQIIEILDLLLGEVGIERLEHRQVLAQGHRDLRRPQLGEEGQEHRSNVGGGPRRSSRPATCAWRRAGPGADGFPGRRRRG